MELKYSRQSMQNRQEESDWQTPNWQPRRRKIRWKDGLTIYSELRKVGILIKIQSILIKKENRNLQPILTSTPALQHPHPVLAIKANLHSVPRLLEIPPLHFIGSLSDVIK